MLRMARDIQDRNRTDKWPRKCVYGEAHQLVFTTRNGTPIEPRNLRRSLDMSASTGDAACTFLLYRDTREAGYLRITGLWPAAVELRGLEPLTLCLQSRCSSS
jgi:hypothetical protein